MPMPKALKIAAGVAVSFIVFAVTIMLLSDAGIVTFQMALLMLVALFGLYLGFGILIAVYRLISRLE
jgi:hypothetical protein